MAHKRDKEVLRMHLVRTITRSRQRRQGIGFFGEFHDLGLIRGWTVLGISGIVGLHRRHALKSIDGFGPSKFPKSRPKGLRFTSPIAQNRTSFYAALDLDLV